MARKAMVIDLDSCIGCNACALACRMENLTPPGIWWGRVMEAETGTFPKARRIFLPVLCNHCKNPICEEVCPTGATYVRADGTVLVKYEECIGCRSCVEACPYGARFYYRKEQTYYPNYKTPLETGGFRKFEEGVVQKCTLCADRVDRGLEPACVQCCPTSARIFGDLDDPDSKVSVMMREKKLFQLLPEKGTDPSVYYLAEKVPVQFYNGQFE